MFDIAFSEILIIFVLALIVLGPEKLPRVAAQVGRWIVRARGMARQFREQLEEEVNLEEARKAEAARSAAEANPPPAAAAPQATTAAPQPEPEQPTYPDSYSHAHPTDSLGRPIPAPADPAPGIDSGQHDWVEGVAAAEKPAQPTANAGYAPSHERGT
jgi:sec-independent protein translocase protein TatB